MTIREYISNDIYEMYKLFCDTIYAINAKDYSKEQLDAWTGGIDLDRWNKSFLEHYTLVALDNNKIIGFGDINKSGYLDRLYVHKNYQGIGIATAICDRLETKVTGIITVHASITAKPFFEKRGYTVLKEQQVQRQGAMLTNFVMEKY